MRLRIFLTKHSFTEKQPRLFLGSMVMFFSRMSCSEVTKMSGFSGQAQLLRTLPSPMPMPLICM